MDDQNLIQTPGKLLPSIKKEVPDEGYEEEQTQSKKKPSRSMVVRSLSESSRRTTLKSSESEQYHLEDEDEVVYEGGLPDCHDDIEYKVIYDGNAESAPMEASEGDNVEIEVRGMTYKVPFSLPCHLCEDTMYLCVRRTQYRGESKEYPAYRCNRKGCQTFRSIRKVFASIGAERSKNSDETSSKYLHKRYSIHHQDALLVERIQMPRIEKLVTNGEKPMTATERMKLANQARSRLFSDFSAKLRQDIVANRRVKLKKNRVENDQGTLLYITKSLNANEIIELQDAIIKVLMTMRKIPVPMTMDDLPMFAHCPISKEMLEEGLQNDQNIDSFFDAFNNAPQPPIPVGFVRRKDNSLIYRNPKPFEVPEILKENSPEKMAESAASYYLRQQEQEATRNVKKMSEKRIRAWKSLKREFDSVERESGTLVQVQPSEVTDNISGDLKNTSKVSIQSILDTMDHPDSKTVQISCDVGCSERKKMKSEFRWIDEDVQFKSDNSKITLSSQYNFNNKPTSEVIRDKKDGTLESISLHEMLLRTLSSPSLFQTNQDNWNSQTGTCKTDDAVPKQLTPPSLANFHVSQQNSIPEGNGYINHNGNYPQDWTNAFYVNPPNDNDMPSSSTSGVEFGNNYSYASNNFDSFYTNSLSPYTYVNPQSESRFTDPSVFLNNFVPSPVNKNAPTVFGENSDKNLVEESARAFEDNKSREEGNENVEKNELLDISMKFDQSVIES